MKNNREAVEDRQKKILNFIKDRGTVKADLLSRTFQISMMTVRRDLQYLEEQGLIHRIHGGAVSMETFREILSHEEKVSFCRERISEYAARFIEDGSTIFINGSRTALNVLKYVGNKKISVYTNNCCAMMEQFPEGVTLHFTGGEMRNKVMIGEYVVRNLLTVSADMTFLGCAAIYEDGEFRYDIPTEIGINEAMIGRTQKELFILADHTKIQTWATRDSSYGSCIYDRAFTLITDDLANPSVIEKLRRQGMKITQVSTSQVREFR